MNRTALPPIVPFAAGALAALIGSGMARSRASSRPGVQSPERPQGSMGAPAADALVSATREGSERRSLEKQLHLLEHTDSLTGAANRVRLRDQLAVHARWR